MPAVALEVIDLVQDPNVDTDRLADTIASDPALASKILKTVNSSFYAQAQSLSGTSQIADAPPADTPALLHST